MNWNRYIISFRTMKQQEWTEIQWYTLKSNDRNKVREIWEMRHVQTEKIVSFFVFFWYCFGSVWALVSNFRGEFVLFLFSIARSVALNPILNLKPSFIHIIIWVLCYYCFVVSTWCLYIFNGFFTPVRKISAITITWKSLIHTACLHQLFHIWRSRSSDFSLFFLLSGVFVLFCIWFDLLIV